MINYSFSSQLIRLWNDRKLPIYDGLVKNYKNKYKYFMFEDDTLVENNNRLYKEFFQICSHINCLQEGIALDKYKVFVGDGSYGSDGWILVLTKDEDFCWLLSGEFNPIEKFIIKDENIHAYNNLEQEFIVPIEKPEKMKIIKL